MGKKKHKKGPYPGVHVPKGGPRHVAEPPSPYPRAEGSPDSWRSSKPIWQFGQMDLEGPWGWSHIDQTGLLNLRDRLIGFETRRWNEILSQKSCGEIPTEFICRDAQVRLSEIGRDDEDSLLELRINGPGRVWGFRQGAAFFFLWWDPDHTVYPMNITGN